MTSTQVISRLDVFEDVLSRMVKIWDPEFAVLTSNEYIASKGGGMPWEVGGWLTYQRGGKVCR
jgi:hypothetical protein